jgi:cytoskeletal protein RodZ
MPPFFKTKKIQPPKTLGEILRGKRKKMEMSLRQVERETKIKKIYLVALEENAWNELPSEVYIAGFLNTYSKTLNLDPKRILKSFKDEHKTHKNIQSRVIENPKELKVNRVYLTPRMIIIGLVILIAIALGGYLWFQVSGFASAPKLLISEPASQEIKTTADKIKIAGTTDKDSGISLNNQPIPVNTAGNFEQIVILSKGINVFEVVSTNTVGKTTTKTLQIMGE